jgi:magnesium chelatase subunit I
VTPRSTRPPAVPAPDAARPPRGVIPVMPFSMIVGQRPLKLALQLAYVAPRVGGVLLSGHRGTGKSTLVRAFSVMMYGELPVTLPISATEDRVIGGLDVDELLQERSVAKPGLIEQANGRVLYVDEVNLLDDHVVNIILDVTASGILQVERDGLNRETEVQFTLVGTMNPSEGGLRPQLLDRFGLMVDVTAETHDAVRTQILQAVLDYDQARSVPRGPAAARVRDEKAADAALARSLRRARKHLGRVDFSPAMAAACARIGREFQAEGHRGDYVMALAARAHAALRGAVAVEPDDVVEVAPLALQHRRAATTHGGVAWSAEENARVRELVGSAPAPGVPQTPS